MGSKKFLIVFFTMLSFVLFSTSVLADTTPPNIFNPIPENNSFIPGGLRAFYVNITEENLDTSTVKLHIISLSAFQQSEPWDVYLMQCSNTTLSNWICNTTVSFAIAGSDTAELYYIDANDTFLNYGYNGTKDNPISFTLDRIPPQINFINPVNGSYVNGIEKIKLEVSDTASGVNESSIKYSLNNLTWYSMSKEGNYFVSDLDTTVIENNQTITIYAKASDNINNTRYAQINITVDNELPSISIIKPFQGETVNDTISLEINVSDKYSGIDNSSVFYFIGGMKKNMDCKGTIYNYNCTQNFDTKVVADGNLTITFNISDIAGNANSSSLWINVYNKIQIPTISVVTPSNNAYVHGKIFVNASVVDILGIVNYLEIKIQKPGYATSWQRMNYAENRYYFYWDTSQLQEGEYEIVLKAVNTLNYLINKTISVTVDNTQPSLMITRPEEYMKGISYLDVIVTDNFGVNSGSVKFNISNYMITTTCTVQLGGKRLVCGGNFNSVLLKDGPYNLLSYAEDIAGNKNLTSMEIKIDNEAPYLSYLKITPIDSRNFTTIKFLADVADKVSYVTSVIIAVNYPDGRIEKLNLSQISSWYGEKYIDKIGTYTIDLFATDFNDNALSLQSIGYFYIGPSYCGNGVCDPNENYCICQADCEAIKCSANQIIDCNSGIPKCVEKGYCGDKICVGEEDCLSCPQDCACFPDISRQVNQTIEGTLEKIISVLKGNVEELISLFSNKMFIASLAFIIALSIFTIYQRNKKLEKKIVSLPINVAKPIEKYKNKLELIEKEVSSALILTDIEKLKDKVRTAIIHSSELEEGLSEKIINSLGYAEANKFKINVKENKEIQNIEKSRKVYIERINSLLNNVIITEDLTVAQKNLKEAKDLFKEFIKLTEREISLFSEILKQL